MPKIVETDIRPTPKPIEQTLAGLSKDRRDWLEVYGSQFKPRKVMAGTCERCTWGSGAHSESCVVRGETIILPPITLRAMIRDGKKFDPLPLDAEKRVIVFEHQVRILSS